MDFVVIDFETANAKRTSACSIGITSVKNNEIISSKEYLIKPHPYYFDAMNTAIHGISFKNVESAPTFDVLWSTISHYFDDTVIVAHNASFDISVLTRTLEYYNIPFPDCNILCTYRISQFLYPDFHCYRLDFLSSIFKIPLCHHNACSDSNACANLLLKFINEKNIQNWNDGLNYWGIDFGFLCENSYLPCRHHSITIKRKQYKRAKDFCNIQVTHYDDDFNNKNIVFTGTLLSMSRAKAMEIVAKGGGVPQERITKTTNYLVVGIQDLKIVKDGQSSKMRKAAEYKKAGCNIEVIGEEQFINMIDEELFD